MMNDLEADLRRLSQDEPPVRLAATEAEVLRRVSGYSFHAREPGSFRVIAVAGALLMGVAGGLVQPEQSGASRSLSRFSGATDLAPSTVLAVDR
jgi:hypothetical protein